MCSFEFPWLNHKIQNRTEQDCKCATYLQATKQGGLLGTNKTGRMHIDKNNCKQAAMLRPRQAFYISL